MNNELMNEIPPTTLDSNTGFLGENPIRNRLMFTREHFPVVLHEGTGYGYKRFWDFNRIEIPPYHPSMAKDGINFKSVPDLIYEAVEATLRDLEEIADKKSYVQAILRDVVKDGKTGRVLFEPQIKQNDLGITVDFVPIVGRFYVGKQEINPYGDWGDQGISIDPKIAPLSFNVPESLTFTPELMKEYEMTDRGLSLLGRRIECPNGWHRHNLETTNAIFYRNLVIALDNAVVREKYQM